MEGDSYSTDDSDGAFFDTNDNNNINNNNNSNNNNPQISQPPRLNKHGIGGNSNNYSNTMSPLQNQIYNNNNDHNNNDNYNNNNNNHINQNAHIQHYRQRSSNNNKHKLSQGEGGESNLSSDSNLSHIDRNPRGYLEKRGQKHRAWRKRYFVLKNDRLNYYKVLQKKPQKRNKKCAFFLCVCFFLWHC